MLSINTDLEEESRQRSHTKSVDLSGSRKHSDAASILIEDVLLEAKTSEGTKTSEVADATKLLISTTDKDVESGYYYDYPKYYRWLILIFFVILSVVMGPAFLNWPPLLKILKWEDAYRHLCPASTVLHVDADGVTIACQAQELAISAMFPLAVAVMFSLDLVAGILLDCFGGKVCCLFGMLLQALGWLLLAFSGPKFNGFLPGVLFLAAGADPGFFGLLSVANLFPGWENTIVAILGAARSISYVNFIIVAAMLKRLSLLGVCLGAAILILAFVVLTFFFVPYQSFPKVSGATQLPTDEKDKETKVAYSQFLNEKPSFNLRSLATKLKAQFSSVIKHAVSFPYALFCLLPLLTLTRNNYYSLSFKQHLPNLGKAYEILNPLSFIPCPLVGVFADKVSTTLTIVGLAVSGAISMVVVVTPGEIFYGAFFWEVVSLLFNFVFISFCISQFYCYIGYVYPQEEMGKLIGIALLIGGCGSLMSTPMFNFAQKSKSFLTMDLTIVGFEVVVIAICIFLYFTMELPVKRKLAGEMKPDVETAKEEPTLPS